MSLRTIQNHRKAIPMTACPHSTIGRLLSRKQAADFITAEKFIISVPTLAKYAHKKCGPPYLRQGGSGRVWYCRECLLSWADYWLMPAVQLDKAS